MNLYFWLFSLYALWITPVTLQWSVHMGKRLSHRLLVRVAGIPLGTERSMVGRGKKPSENAAESRFLPDIPLLLALIRQGHAKRALHALRLEGLDLRMHISFEDAALTAMCYASVRAFLQTLLMCLRHPPQLRGHVEMDFQGTGTELFVRCILSARLGNLLSAALRLIMAVIPMRAERLKAEEERYAAASH